MSTKGLFPAVSGAIAQDLKLQTIANNIANANTTGFKRDGQTFREYLTAAEKDPDVLQVPRVPASIESFYDIQGGDRGYVESNGTFTNFSQGQLRPTGSTLDVAIEGKGLFEVMTPQGVRLSRNGQLKIDSTGTLVTKEGFPVLKEGTQDPAQRRIQVDGRNLTISNSGDIYDNGNQLGRLSVVEVANPDSLQKVGSSMYALKPNFAETLIPSVDSQVKQGFVELSNVNIVEEMTDMISASRSFETAQRAMKAFDQMDDKLVNQVPKT